MLGVGDDCALIQPGAGMQLAISSDMLVEGRHFFPSVDPVTLGHKALAVNLSDLAACGAEPLAFTLALALPRVDPVWLAGFSRGLWALADLHGCELIGGDTTGGPLNICITVFGSLPQGTALLRSGAKVGDDIYVSGTLGQARFALDALQGRVNPPTPLLALVRQRLEQPTPRVALGQALRGIASAAIDISDGLVGDLGHLLKASRLGASLETAMARDLFASQAQRPAFQPVLSDEQQLDYVLAGGDDYELAFCAPIKARAAVQAAALQSQTPVTRIGRTEAQTGLRLRQADGQLRVQKTHSFDHFA